MRAHTHSSHPFASMTELFSITVANASLQGTPLHKCSCARHQGTGVKHPARAASVCEDMLRCSVLTWSQAQPRPFNGKVV